MLLFRRSNRFFIPSLFRFMCLSFSRLRFVLTIFALLSPVAGALAVPGGGGERLGSAVLPPGLSEVAQSAFLKAGNPGGKDMFGEAIAVSGNTAVIGVRRDDSAAKGVNGNGADDTALDSGAVYVFVRKDGVWEREAYLKASNTEEWDGFGTSVAISGDTLAVGAPYEDSAASAVNGNETDNSAADRGAVYVFTRANGMWTMESYLKPGNQTSQFGAAVAVSGDTVAVGAPADSSASQGVNPAETSARLNDSGAVYVFRRSGGEWSQEAWLKAHRPGQSDIFGFSVGLDGDTLVAGAPYENSSAKGVNGNPEVGYATRAGAAYVFGRTGAVWSQRAYLKASNTDAFDAFGTAVTVSGDTLAVGAPREASSATGVNGSQALNNSRDRGAAYVFMRAGETWEQRAYLKPSNKTSGFGTALSISGDLLAVGAPRDSAFSTGVNGNQETTDTLFTGAAYAFFRQTGEWSQIAFLKASNTGFNDQFGSAVAADGGAVAVAAPMEDSSGAGPDGGPSNENLEDSGAVYVFETFGTPTPDLSVSETEEISAGSSVSMGSFPKGTSGQARVFTMRNSGTAPLTGLAFTQEGPHRSDFSITLPAITKLAPGESASFPVLFRPSGVGARSFLLRIVSNDPDGSPYDLHFTGTGEAVTELKLTHLTCLKPTPVTGYELFGQCLAVSGDVMVVGASWLQGFRPSGDAYVFVRTGGGWEQQARLRPTEDFFSPSFGASVAVSGDTVVVGAPREDLSNLDLQGNPVGVTDNQRFGAVYVFTRAAGQWTRTARLTPDPAGPPARFFGKSVAISGDTLAAASENQSDNGIQVYGAAHVLKREGAAWSPVTRLAPAAPHSRAEFGYSLAMEGDYLVAGAPGDLPFGAAYVFHRGEGGWSEQARLFQEEGGRFGAAVGISGATVLVGAPQGSGSGHVYLRDGSSWSLQASLRSPYPDVDDRFGMSVAISGDVLVLGAGEEDSNAAGVDGDGGNNQIRNAGAAYAFTRTGGTWTPQSYLKADPPHDQDFFGAAVGISGNLIAVGAPYEDSTGKDAAGKDRPGTSMDSGMVHLFGLEPAVREPEISVQRESILQDGALDDAGAVAVGASGPPLRFLVHNSGTADLAGISWTVSGPQAGDFSIVPPARSSVVPCGYLPMEVTFTPGAGGVRECLIRIVSNDGDESPFTLRLKGEGTSGEPVTRALAAWVKASDAAGGDEFGTSVAVHGDTVIVGAPNLNGEPDHGSRYAGAAYIFVRRAGGWVQEARLISAVSPQRGFFGSSVAVHHDTAVIGAPHQSAGASDSGGAFVFVRNGETWSRQAVLKPANSGFTDLFGSSVAIDGDTLVVGAIGEGSGRPGEVVEEGDPRYAFSGAAYVYVREGDRWIERTMLKANPPVGNAQLGSSVAVSGDTVLAGARGEPGRFGASGGAAYVFTRGANGEWSQQTRLGSPTPEQMAYFGHSVSLEGDLAVVGSPEDESKGAAYVYRRAGGEWNKVQRLQPFNPGLNLGFGVSVAVSRGRILVGASMEDSGAIGVDEMPDTGARDSGAAYLFTPDGAEWRQAAYLKASNTGESDLFGKAVAMHGGVMVAGAPWEDSSGGLNPDQTDNSAENSGAAYIYTTLDPPVVTLTGNGLVISDGDDTPESPDHTDFGSAPFTGGLVSRNYHLTNTGMVPLVPGAPLISGPQAGDFRVIGEWPASVAPGGSVPLEVAFDPAAAGARNAEIRFTTNDPAVPVFRFAVRGTGVNTAPLGDTQTLVTPEDTPLTVHLTGRDIDGQNLSFRVSVPPSRGRLSGEGREVVYTPDQDYHGADSFEFLVNDGFDDSAPAKILLEITPVNDGPVATLPIPGVVQSRPGLINTLDLAAFFRDEETASGDLTYAIASPIPGDPGIGVVTGSRLALEGLRSGDTLLTVTASDSGGLQAEAAFSYRVKHSPLLTGAIPGQRVLIGRPLTLDLSAFFTDLDADPLTYHITGNTDPSSAEAVLGAARLSLTALRPGAAGVDVLATDSDGNTVSARIAVSTGTEFPTLTPGGLTLDRQTGLLIQTVLVTNTTGLPLPGFRLIVTGLPSGVTLYNSAAPTGGGGAWVEPRTNLAADAALALTLSYHDPSRRGAFTPSFDVEPLRPAGAVAGDAVPFAVERLVAIADGARLIEFSAVPGRLYQVEYSSDLSAWEIIPAVLRAGANRVHYIDRGPPDTAAHPSLSAARYYRVRDVTP